MLIIYITLDLYSITILRTILQLQRHISIFKTPKIKETRHNYQMNTGQFSSKLPVKILCVSNLFIPLRWPVTSLLSPLIPLYITGSHQKLTLICGVMYHCTVRNSSAMSIMSKDQSNGSQYWLLWARKNYWYHLNLQPWKSHVLIHIQRNSLYIHFHIQSLSEKLSAMRPKSMLCPFMYN